jgi:hypothetical protein
MILAQAKTAFLHAVEKSVKNVVFVSYGFSGSKIL